MVDRVFDLVSCRRKPAPTRCRLRDRLSIADSAVCASRTPLFLAEPLFALSAHVAVG